MFRKKSVSSTPSELVAFALSRDPIRPYMHEPFGGYWDSGWWVGATDGPRMALVRTSQSVAQEVQQLRAVPTAPPWTRLTDNSTLRAVIDTELFARYRVRSLRMWGSLCALARHRVEWLPEGFEDQAPRIYLPYLLDAIDFVGMVVVHVSYGPGKLDPIWVHNGQKTRICVIMPEQK